jgi:hypothetical protein
MSCLKAIFIPNQKQKQLEDIFTTIDASEPFKTIVVTRYITLLHEYKKRARKYSFGFFTLELFISIGSLVVPALLSLTPSDNTFWFAWFISLFVSISNSALSILRIDKKYYTIHTVYNQLISEGWQFANLTGNYYSPPDLGHDTQIQHFAYRLERIYMKQIQEEYMKVKIGEGETSAKVQPVNQDTLLPKSLPTAASQTIQANSAQPIAPSRNTINSLLPTPPPFFELKSQEQVNASRAKRKTTVVSKYDQKKGIQESGSSSGSQEEQTLESIKERPLDESA